MDLHPIQGEVEILLVTSCYRNWNKCWPGGPLGTCICTSINTFPKTNREILIIIIMNDIQKKFVLSFLYVNFSQLCIQQISYIS